MDAPLEFLTSAGRRRNRQWPDDEKARIGAETLRTGAIAMAMNSLNRGNGQASMMISNC